MDVEGGGSYVMLSRFSDWATREIVVLGGESRFVPDSLVMDSSYLYVVLLAPERSTEADRVFRYDLAHFESWGDGVGFAE